MRVVECYPPGLCHGVTCQASDFDGTLWDLTAKYHIHPNQIPPVSVPEPSVS